MNDLPTTDTTRAIRFFQDKLGFLMAPSRLKAQLDAADKAYRVLDARHPDTYAESRIPDATFVDADDLESQWHLFDKEKIHVIYCYSELCHRAARVCLAAALQGYAVMELHGGFEGWAEYPMPVDQQPLP